MKSRQQIFRPNAPPLSPLTVYHLQTFMLLAVTSFQKHVSQKRLQPSQQHVERFIKSGTITPVTKR